jgi:hypothetical protein
VADVEVEPVGRAGATPVAVGEPVTLEEPVTVTRFVEMVVVVLVGTHVELEAHT